MSSEMRQDAAAAAPRAERGGLIVVSAPSGAGKSSLVHRALERVEGLRFSVSYTTRPPRAGEQDGVHYRFVGAEEFTARRERDEFLEWAEVHGNFYGTHRGAIEEILAGGFDAILDIDVQGAEQIRHSETEATTVFILPPSQGVLESRLRLRNMNTGDDLERRLRGAAIEVQLYSLFDYVIVNDDLDRATAQLEAIIAAERQRPQRNRNRIERIIETFEGE